MKKRSLVFTLSLFISALLSCNSQKSSPEDTTQKSTSKDTSVVQEDTTVVGQAFFSVEKIDSPEREIPIQEADDARDYYRKSKEHFKVKYLKNGVPVVDTLQAFVFSSADLEALIHYQGSKKAKSIVLYFGREANDVVDNAGKNAPSYKIIVMGTDVNGKLINKAFDKADPCPPAINCPQ